MPSTTRMAIARESVARLADDALEPLELLHEVGERVRRAVPFDLGGWMTFDPDTMLPNGSWPADPRQGLLDALWRNELLTPDVLKFSQLAQARSPVATLHTTDARAADESTRRRVIFEPAGVGDELRVVFRAHGATWGGGCLLREDGAGAFDADERRFLAAIAEDVGRGLRRGLSRRADGSAAPDPGVVVLSDGFRAVAATPEAERLLGLVPGDAAPTLFGVAVAAFRAGSSARVRVRLVDGTWRQLHAARLPATPSESPRVAVVIEAAARGDIVSLRLRLHGLTAREREVVELMVGGLTTGEIAARLFISAHTLRGHLKAIFAKVGTTSRAELIAAVTAAEPAGALPTSSRPAADGTALARLRDRLSTLAPPRDEHVAAG